MSWFVLKKEEKERGEVTNFPPVYDILDKPKNTSKIFIKLLSIPDTKEIYELLGYDEEFGQIIYSREAYPKDGNFSVLVTYVKEDEEMELVDLSIEGEGHKTYRSGAVIQETLDINETFKRSANIIAKDKKWLWTEEIKLSDAYNLEIDYEKEEEKENYVSDYDFLNGRFNDV